MRPCVWCVRGPGGGVSRTSPWWRCWCSSFSLWTHLSTAPTGPWSEEVADPGPGWEGPAGNDASLAAFWCKVGSPARTAGTYKTLLGPCRKEERWGKRKRSRQWEEVRSDYVGKRGLKLKPKNLRGRGWTFTKCAKLITRCETACNTCHDYMWLCIGPWKTSTEQPSQYLWPTCIKFGRSMYHVEIYKKASRTHEQNPTGNLLFWISWSLLVIFAPLIFHFNKVLLQV